MGFIFTSAVLLILAITCSCPHDVYSDPQTPRDTSNGNKNLLIFGGNGFIGSHAVQVLLVSGYNITCVHRNNDYWNWKAEFADKVSVLTCDRNFDLYACENLYKIEHMKFFAVIDFSGFVDLAVMQGIQLLRHKFERYIYISSDSVYDIVDKRHSWPSKEEDGVFPSDKQVRDRLKQGNQYAEKKLTSEFVVDLLSQDYNGDYDYTILRIPDVFGPKDNTFRFWYYMTITRLAYYKNSHILLPPNADTQLISLVYVEDIAQSILQILLDYRNNEARRNNIYNFAYPEPLAITTFVEKLWNILNFTDGGPNLRFSQTAHSLYPSVTSGPIDVKKFLTVFKGFHFTGIDSALQQSVRFYLASEKTRDIIEMQQFAERLVQLGVFSCRPVF